MYERWESRSVEDGGVIGMNPTAHGGCEGVVDSGCRKRHPNDFQMSERAFRQFGGEINERILGLVTGAELLRMLRWARCRFKL
jgi:hypothetical protein